VYIYKPPVSKPWISLGSEKEIEEESVQESKKREGLERNKELKRQTPGYREMTR